MRRPIHGREIQRAHHCIAVLLPPQGLRRFTRSDRVPRNQPHNETGTANHTRGRGHDTFRDPDSHLPTASLGRLVGVPRRSCQARGGAQATTRSACVHIPTRLPDGKPTIPMPVRSSFLHIPVVALSPFVGECGMVRSRPITFTKSRKPSTGSTISRPHFQPREPTPYSSSASHRPPAPRNCCSSHTRCLLGLGCSIPGTGYRLHHCKEPRRALDMCTLAKRQHKEPPARSPTALTPGGIASADNGFQQLLLPRSTWKAAS